MDEEIKIISDIVKELGVKDIFPEVYKDLLKPAVKESGKNLLTVAKAVSIAFSPLKGAIWGFEKIQDWILIKVTEKLSKTCPDNIQSPRMNVAGQILIKLSFFKDEAELREMFANLLAAAMDKSRANFAHPSYVTIIQQLTVDEAKILKWITEKKMHGSIAFETSGYHGNPPKEDDSIEYQFKEVCRLSEVSNLDLNGAYLENLKRLRIFEEHNLTEVQYIPETPHDEYGEAYVDQETTRDLYVGEFGTQFLLTCVKD